MKQNIKSGCFFSSTSCKIAIQMGLTEKKNQESNKDKKTQKDAFAAFLPWVTWDICS